MNLLQLSSQLVIMNNSIGQGVKVKSKGKKWDEVKAQLSAKHTAGVVSWVEGYVDRNRFPYGPFPRKSLYVDEDGILR